MERVITLMIIDDHDAVRRALESRLRQIPGIEVVGCTGSREEGIHQALLLRPDVVLLETKRSDGAGLEICRRIARGAPETAVIVLTSYEDEQERHQAFLAGARRYVLKDIDSAQLLREIQVAQAVRSAA